MRSLRHREIKETPDVSVEGENGDYATESQRNMHHASNESSMIIDIEDPSTAHTQGGNVTEI